MNLRKSTLVVFAFSTGLALHAFDTGIGPFTTARLGLFFGLMLFVGMPGPKTAKAPILFVIGGLLSIVAIGLISSVINLSTNPELLNSLLSWFLIPISVLTFSYVAKVHCDESSIDLVMKTMSFLGIVALLWTSYFVFSRLDVSSLSIKESRLVFVDLPSSTNRFMLSLLTVNMFSFLHAIGVVRINGVSRLRSIIITLFFAFLLVLSGSRQNVVMFVMFLSLSSLVNLSLRNLLRAFFGFVGALILFAILYSYINNFINIEELFVKRFIEATQDQLANRSERYMIYLAAVETIKLNPIFGIGPGNFLSLHGKFPHNSYLGISAEFGLLGLLLLLLLLSVILYFNWMRIRKEHNSSPLVYIHIYTICFVIIACNFNDVIRSHLFWIFISMAAILNIQRIK